MKRFKFTMSSAAEAKLTIILRANVFCECATRLGFDASYRDMPPCGRQGALLYATLIVTLNVGCIGGKPSDGRRVNNNGELSGCGDRLTTYWQSRGPPTRMCDNLILSQCEISFCSYNALLNFQSVRRFYCMPRTAGILKHIYLHDEYR